MAAKRVALGHERVLIALSGGTSRTLRLTAANPPVIPKSLQTSKHRPAKQSGVVRRHDVIARALRCAGMGRTYLSQNGCMDSTGMPPGPASNGSPAPAAEVAQFSTGQAAPHQLAFLHPFATVHWAAVRADAALQSDSVTREEQAVDTVMGLISVMNLDEAFAGASHVILAL